MKQFKNGPVRAVVAAATLVALIASVGAPFKWSMAALFELLDSLTG